MDPSTICMNFGACPPVMQALRLPVWPYLCMSSCMWALLHLAYVASATLLTPPTVLTNPRKPTSGHHHPSSEDRLLLQVPPLPPVLVAKAAALRMHAHELSAENDFCDTCKLVVTEAASILGNLVSSTPPYFSLLCAMIGTVM